MPCKRFEDCLIPVGLSALDLWRGKIKILTSGSLSKAIAASACFPVLFAPVQIDGRSYIDAGILDNFGLKALQSIPQKEKLIVNIVFDKSDVRKAPNDVPTQLVDQGAVLLSVCMLNIAKASLASIDTSGRVCYQESRDAMRKALQGSCPLQELSSKHYVCYVDGANM
eukprot:gnl/TRDRNA2_/TRDRNA2_155098_c1_seq1.p1 gnl/TRDRNA2_/TRDRNA2_155098_c1~~gnl/TRDRNA2_/TRDRNA2_155098_c1_seq1.p1  ORF type:complete len:168 (-),score=21.43 gnl/TRDRNA2_/TRDRNA2_155098_c1_seq1:126-629(-)